MTDVRLLASRFVLFAEDTMNQSARTLDELAEALGAALRSDTSKGPGLEHYRLYLLQTFKFVRAQRRLVPNGD